MSPGHSCDSTSQVRQTFQDEDDDEDDYERRGTPSPSSWLLPPGLHIDPPFRLSIVNKMLASQTVRPFTYHKGKTAKLYSLPALEEAGIAKISRLPVSIRIVLESVLRNCDGKKISEEDVTALARWNAKEPALEEIPFIVARIVLQHFTGWPLLVDLSAMRDAVARLGKDHKLIEPLVPGDLVVDHSVQVDFAGSAEALSLNRGYEYERN